MMSYIFKNPLFNNIKLKKSSIVYDDFDIIPTIDFEQQKWSFKEDLLQMEFVNNYIIDVGWYPEFDIRGHFIIKVIKNFDWSNPLFEKKSKNLNTLKKYLQQAIDFVDILPN